MNMPSVSRRRVLKVLAIGAGAIVTGVGFYAWRIEPHWVEVTENEIRLSQLGKAFEGYRIVQIADLHVGHRVSADYLYECMDRVNALRPDLIVVTGDLIQGGLGNQIATVAGILSRLHCPDGVVVVLGNHDYHRWTPGDIRFDIADRLAAAVEQVGGIVLRNRSRILSRSGASIALVGLDELLVGRCDAKAAFAGVSSGGPIIVLSHNPDSMGILRHWPGDVVLSSHTHGGQVVIPFFGAPKLPVTHREYGAGLVWVGDKAVYVNRGLGHLLRVRFNCRPEITVHTLRRGEPRRGPS